MTTITIFDFNESTDISSWEIENDTVMGGVSSSSIDLNTDGHAVFSGKVSTANNGGFAQVQHDCNFDNIGDKKTVAIHLKGDGKKYQLRLKRSKSDRHNYVYTFETSGKWETVEIPIHEMYASFRGRTLDLPNFEANTVTQIAILIGNKKNEAFELIMDKIEMR